MNLRGKAEGLLTAFASQLGAEGATVPARRYVAPGNLVPWDGEQLVVVLQTVGQGQPGAPVGTPFRPGAQNFYAEYAVALVREVPSLSGGSGPFAPQVPSSEELSEAGISGIDDVEVLVKAAGVIYQTGAVVPTGQGMVIGSCDPLGPEGGLAGARLLLGISV